MKMLAKIKKSTNDLKLSFEEWSSETKDKVVRFIIDSGKDEDSKKA